MRLSYLGLLAALLVALAGCAGEPDRADPATAAPPPATGSNGDQRFPDVLDVVAEPSGPGVWRFDVTISSPYDSPERYADAYRVRSVDGRTAYGVRELAHDHADEQPFTRSLSGVRIPEDVTEVVVEGRDLANG